MSSSRRLSALASLVLVAVVSAPAAAQSTGLDTVRPADAVSGSPFLSRGDFSFGWASLVTGDRRFDWQGTIRFDLDIYRYRAGRLRFRGDYEAVLGRERRRYDLNQGNYSFDVSGSVDVGAAEVAVISQHVSRHVVDRDNVPAISWNTAGARIQSAWTRAGGFDGTPPVDEPRATRLDGEVEISRAMQQAYVDYSWISRARLSVAHPVSPVVSIVATATGEVVGVKRGLVRDERVCGGRVEGGVRVRGGAAALEAFVGYERRIDAYPTDRFRVRWFTAGVRIATLSARRGPS